jgi:hypothetical protein
VSTVNDATAPSAVASGNAAGPGRYWLVAAVCFVLLVIRGWDRFTHPELFAEGVRFMGAVLNHGWWSLLEIHDQALHVAPKLVAVLAVNVVPVEYIPAFTNLACCAVMAAVMASLSRPCYRWIIPSDAARVALSLLLTLSPGQIEILGNLAGLHWSLLLWLALLTLKDPEYPLTAWELVIAALTLLSSAGAVVFLPLAFLRLVLARGRRVHPAYRSVLGLPRLTGETLLFLLLCLVSIYLAVNFFSQEKAIVLEEIDITGAMRGLDDLLPSLGALFTTFYVLHPFLGTQHASLFLVSMPFYPLVGVSLLLVTVLLWRVRRETDYRFWLIPAWIVCLMLLGVMLSIVRYWSFYGIFSYPYWDWWTRYNYVFACTGLVFMFLLFRPRNLWPYTHWSTVAALVMIIAYTSQAGTITTRAQGEHDEDGYAVKRYGKKEYWSRTAEDLESAMTTGCPRQVKVKSYPRGKWRFVYESPIENADCD